MGFRRVAAEPAIQTRRLASAFSLSNHHSAVFGYG
jgi:hypothetical protein